jgi:hypothetical protein
MLTEGAGSEVVLLFELQPCTKRVPAAVAPAVIKNLRRENLAIRVYQILKSRGFEELNRDEHQLQIQFNQAGLSIEA